jgi:hypothetical protein
VYSYQVKMPCRDGSDKARGYAIVREGRGTVQEHKLNFLKGELTLFVTVEPENDVIFKEVLQRLRPDATILSSSRGTFSRR